MRDITLAAVSMQSEFGCIEKNIARMESFVKEGSARGVDMICFPELSVTGYTVKEDPQLYAEPVPGPVSDRIVRIAKEYRVLIMAGVIEKAERVKPYISQIVAGPDGIIGVHRKTHLSPQEKDVYRPGHIIETFKDDNVSFGIQLCYETHFPEMSTIMALQGVEVIFFLYASPNGEPEEKRDSWMRSISARAFDNGVFIVACNQAGDNGMGLAFPGVIMILNPAGKIQDQYTGFQEKMIITELKEGDLKKIRTHRMGYFMENRRPELYKAITQESLDKNLDICVE
ncbi:MAG TPA: nitrilase-related carbon-nitrogen hydrolase [Desulfatiglandales bacterium]|nr:nitrilase-related carbon-nitrogen hydrolase [Desulfatiglandales bacterium]